VTNKEHECFQVLHPWAYDLDAVDIKYIVNNNLETQICEDLKGSVDAQLFWLSFFKPQLSCSADEFFEAVRELAEMSNLPGFFARHIKEYEAMMGDCHYVISTDKNAADIIRIVESIANAGTHNVLRHQLHFGGEASSCYADMRSMASEFTFETNPSLDYFKDSSSDLGQLSLVQAQPYE
jgi:hypothetical protein